MSSDLSDPPQNQTTRHGAYPREGNMEQTKRREPDKHFTLHPDSYDGSTVVGIFIKKFSIVATHNQWHPDEKLAFLQCSLKSQGQNLLWEYGASAEFTYCMTN